MKLVTNSLVLPASNFGGWWDDSHATPQGSRVTADRPDYRSLLAPPILIFLELPEGIQPSSTAWKAAAQAIYHGSTYFIEPTTRIKLVPSGWQPDELSLHHAGIIGWASRLRTRNLPVNGRMLYQLSYNPKIFLLYHLKCNQIYLYLSILPDRCLSGI